MIQGTKFVLENLSVGGGLYFIIYFEKGLVVSIYIYDKKKRIGLIDLVGRLSGVAQ